VEIKGPRGLRGPRGNGGQEFGELKATCAGIAKTLDEFRSETKERFENLEKNYGRRIYALERARTYFAGAMGAVTLIGLVAWGVIKVLTHMQ